MAGGIHGRGHAWQGACMAGGHAWHRGACIGACMAGGMYGSGEGGHEWHTHVSVNQSQG